MAKRSNRISDFEDIFCGSEDFERPAHQGFLQYFSVGLWVLFILNYGSRKSWESKWVKGDLGVKWGWSATMQSLNSSFLFALHLLLLESFINVLPDRIETFKRSITQREFWSTQFLKMACFFKQRNDTARVRTLANEKATTIDTKPFPCVMIHRKVLATLFTLPSTHI